MLTGLVGILLLLERRRPLRERADPGLRRLARNAAVAGTTALVVNIVERPLVTRLGEQVARRRWGLVPSLRLPAAAATVVTLALLDYTLYLWHILLHRLPLLWRFHAAHHVDLDLDVSTALRFHFGEFLASVPWRLAQVLLIGVDRRRLALWQKLTLAEVLFHHADLRLPLGLERWLARLIVTPRLHGVHHSTRAEERDSNFSSGLALWDTVHGTGHAMVPQREIVIGVPPYRETRQVTLARTLLLPFRSLALGGTALALSVSPSPRRCDAGA